MPTKLSFGCLLVSVLIVNSSFGLATPPPPPTPSKGRCQWVSGNNVSGGIVRASIGEVVLFKFCVFNNDEPRKLFIIVRQDPDPDFYVQDGLEIIEAPRFAKEDFGVRESQAFFLKVRVKSPKRQMLEIYIVDESRSINPRDFIATGGVMFNDPAYKNTPVRPWDETRLCDFSDVH